ncbi:hypothetical protein OOZ15_10430 [Galbibacter sp. EGI 63066]|uniref:hypothetical protein n=1 Tax=Galbibacter sp. EGI 63066 TaxID=2993559 RepID=UPI002249753B|nr:hypothetical protein [Galbibacter sp. EGI 63066]MCX2680357.1 hypothetical protein [Galbibacter sp. EGI 63066]
MKSFLRNFLMFILPATALIVSCNDDSDEIKSGESAITPEEVRASMQAEDLSNELDNVIDLMVSDDFLNTASKDETTANRGWWMPECLTVTSEATGEGFTVTMDFGEGCEMHHGKVFSGSFTVLYTTVNDSETMTFNRNSTVTFDNFAVDSVTVNGTKSFEHSFTEGENPMTVAVTDIQMTWEDDTSFTISSEKTREWVEGFHTGAAWNESAFLITGNASVTRRDGGTFTSEIITPLRAEFSCHYIVSGVLTYSRNGETAEVDFGDGTCDDKAMYTGPDGETVEITLEKGWEKD